MNRIRAWIRGFFGFSTTETNGFLILLPLMLLLLFVEPIYQAWFTSKPLDITHDAKILDSIVLNWEFKKKDSSVNNATKPKIRAFKFDPNKVSETELIDLGFSKGVANRIVNYRAKGGRFYFKADFKKIYGIDTTLILSLYPLISLPDKINEMILEKKYQPTFLVKSIERFDINLADTSQLIKLKGIGSKLAIRILKYRERLGGFVSENQLSEIYGLDSLVIRELNKNTFVKLDFHPTLININTANEKELTALPYIKFSVAKVIIAYRFQNGNFNEVDELQKIALIDAVLFQKIKPYLTIKK